MDKLDVLGCPCMALTEDQVAQQITSIVNSSESGYSVAINAEKIWEYCKGGDFKKIVDASIFPYPDGAGAVLGLKWLHGALSEKVNMPLLSLEVANDSKMRTYIIGASEVNHDLAIDNIKARYRNIQLVGNMHGYHSKERMVKGIISAKPQLILLALGSPRQEILAAELVATCNFGFFVGCGGALDILSGVTRRAPKYMVDNNLEWLYRLYKQPLRARRQIFLPLFLIKLVCRAMKNRFLA
mgnify:CR=1 FL=1